MTQSIHWICHLYRLGFCNPPPATPGLAGYTLNKIHRMMNSAGSYPLSTQIKRAWKETSGGTTQFVPECCKLPWLKYYKKRETPGEFGFISILKLHLGPCLQCTVYSFQLAQIASKCLREPCLMSTIKCFPKMTPSQICLEFQAQPQHGPS